MAERKLNGAAVKALRDAYGIDQKVLASDIGVSAGYLSHLEKGEKQCRPGVTVRIANRLGVPIDAITSTVPDRIVA